MRKFITALLAYVAMLGLLFAVPNATQAQPIYNSFTAEDMTQTYDSPYCYILSKPWCNVPKVTAHSYFNTTMINGRNFWHYPGDWQYDIGPSAGQQIGLMCWMSGGAAGGIWEKVDARLNIQNAGGVDPWITYGSYLWIGYVNDADVNLSYFDRINAVPHC